MRVLSAAVDGGLESRQRERLRLGLLLVWPTAALLALAGVPFAQLLRISFAPPDPSAAWGHGFTLAAYATLGERYVLQALWHSFELACLVAVIATMLGLPFTALMARMRNGPQTAWLIFLLTTLTLSDVLVAFAWQVLLAKRVGLSQLLVAAGWLPRAESLTPSPQAVVACLVYLVLPFNVLTLYPAFSGLDRSLLEAARTLGATPARAFWTVTLPLTRGPIATALLLSAVLTLGAYVPPLVLGRPQGWPLAVLIGDAALAGHDLPRAAAMSIGLLLVTALLAWLLRRGAANRSRDLS
jgi:putative spermidine/putrescine transport system permease protein